MNETYISLVSSNAWDRVHLLKGIKFVRCKWVNQTKYAFDGSVERLMVSLFAKGFPKLKELTIMKHFPLLPN